MAKRRSAGKIQPAPLELGFEIPSGSSYIDLSQCASLINRRFYRQGLNWAVAGFKLYSSSGVVGQLEIQKIPQTWVASNAWEKCFRAWKRQQDEALADGNNESIRAAFNDFKIHMDADHITAGFGANLIPVTYSLLNSEWESSQIVIPNFGAPGVNYEPYFHMVGDDVPGIGGSLGMIKAYANSRSVPQSPDPSVPANVLSNENFLNMMFDVGDNNEDVMDNLQKNNDLPYDQIDYPGADVQSPILHPFDLMKISATSIGSISSISGTNFPCGLIKIVSSADTGSFTLQVSLVPGPNRGYLTQPMTEM